MTQRQFNATVEWDGHAWVAILDARPNVFTQSPRLDRIKRQLAEVIALMLDEDVSEDQITTRVQIEGKLGEEVELLRLTREALNRDLQAVASRTAETAVALQEQGLSYRDIGELTGVSYQRVGQLLAQR